MYKQGNNCGAHTSMYAACRTVHGLEDCASTRFWYIVEEVHGARGTHPPRWTWYRFLYTLAVAGQIKHYMPA